MADFPFGFRPRPCGFAGRRRKSLVAIRVVIGLFVGCGGRPVSSAHAWLIASYDNGVITVQHDGNTYKVTCDTSTSFNNADSLTDPRNAVEFHTCDTATCGARSPAV